LIDPANESVEEAFRDGYSFTVLASDVFLLWKWSERMRGIIKEAKQEKITVKK